MHAASGLLAMLLWCVADASVGAVGLGSSCGLRFWLLRVRLFCVCCGFICY